MLQLDSAKLEADGLDLVPFSQSVARFAPGTRMTIVCATTFDDLLRRLAELHGQTFEVVAVVGHSNERGLVLAAGRPVDSWDTVAQYLKPFEPRRLVLVACRAGRPLPARILFSALPKLRRIFATPALANRVQGQVMVALLPYVLKAKVPPRDGLRALQVALAVLKGRQLWEWRRTDFERDHHDPIALFAQEVVANLIGELIALLGSR